MSQLSHRLDLSPPTAPTQTQTRQQTQAHRKLRRHQVVLWGKLREGGRGDEQQWLTGSTFHYTFFCVFVCLCRAVECSPTPPPPPSCTHTAPAFAKPIHPPPLLPLPPPITSPLLPEHSSPPPPPLSAGAHFSPDDSRVSSVCGGVRLCACEDF